MQTPSCPFCNAAVLPEPFLRGTTAYTTGTDSGVAPCLGCAKPLEFRVRSGSLDLGYSYWAGSFHFEPLFSIHTPGLRQTRTGITVSITLHDRLLYSGQSS